jgi:hypothetical protein
MTGQRDHNFYSWQAQNPLRVRDIILGGRYQLEGCHCPEFVTLTGVRVTNKDIYNKSIKNKEEQNLFKDDVFDYVYVMFDLPILEGWGHQKREKGLRPHEIQWKTPIEIMLKEMLE